MKRQAYTTSFAKPTNSEPSRRVKFEAARIINSHRILYMRLASENIVKAVVRGSRDVYIVTINLENGYTSCTCPAGLRGLYCKHVEAVKQVLQTVYNLYVGRNLRHHKTSV